MPLHSIVHLLLGELSISSHLRVKNMSKLLLNPINEHFWKEGLDLVLRDHTLPISSKAIYSPWDPD